jgi:predicted DNA binding protein
MGNTIESNEEGRRVSETNSASTPLADEDAKRCNLYVELGISFPSHCCMSEQIPALESADLFVNKDECLTKLSCGGDTESGVYVMKQETCSDCICHEFDKYDCPPEIERIEDQETIVSCYLSDREQLRSLITDLKDGSERVRLLKVVEIEKSDDGGHDRSLRFDLTQLTETQRETLEVAVTTGYYDDPKRISLEALAEKLDVTKSALSRRLKRAEANLVSQIVRTE